MESGKDQTGLYIFTRFKLSDEPVKIHALSEALCFHIVHGLEVENMSSNCLEQTKVPLKKFCIRNMFKGTVGEKAT